MRRLSNEICKICTNLPNLQQQQELSQRQWQKRPFDQSFDACATLTQQKNELLFSHFEQQFITNDVVELFRASMQQRQ